MARQQTTDNRQQTTDNRQQTTDNRQQTTDNRQRYYSIDALRLLLVFFVVFIHFKSSWHSSAITAICRVAVPLFFMFSGFFLYNHDYKIVRQKVKKTLSRMLLLTFLSTAFYYIFEITCIYLNAGGDEVAIYTAQVFSFRTLINLLLFNVNPFGYGFHLWYLFAYIYVLLFYLLIAKIVIKFSTQFLILCGVLLCIFVFLSAYYKLLLPQIYDAQIFQTFPTGSLHYSRNAWFDGFPFFTIGFLYAKSKTEKRNFILLKNMFLFIAIIVLSIETIYENRLVGWSEIYISTIPLVMCIFIWAVNNKYAFEKTIFPKLGKLYSLPIYIIHVAINFCVITIPTNISALAPAYDFIWLFRPLIVFLASLLASMLYVAIKKRLAAQ